MKKILVTGAGGFIGGHLVSRLMQENYKITCVDIKSFDNLISVYQFGVCLNENKNNNISFGVIKRSIDNINNTR